MRQIILLLLIAFGFLTSYAQFTLVKPNGSLEVSGYVTTFYNQRFYKAGETDKKKNRFNLDFAVVKLDGVVNKVWNYQIQLNNAALFSPESNEGFLMDANASFNPLDDRMEIKLGWMKIPFCRSSLVPNTESPFLQRPNVARGGTFSRRDLGATIRYSIFNKKINIYAGAFNGLGTQSLLGDNDQSGTLEYTGRLELSYPARYRHIETDLVHVKVPMFSIGVDGRYANKKTTFGVDYPYEILDGRKTSYSANADFAYQGFSLHAEAIQMKLKPNDTTLLFSKPTNYFMTGGVIASANYYIKKIKTIVAVRYDDFNPNDLVKGDKEASMSFALNYLMDGHRSCLKLQYWKRLKDKDANAVWSEDQLRLAYQLMF